MDEAVGGYVGAVAETLRAALGRDLVGLYLHGSAALHDYHADRSDIDLLAVCATPLDEATRDAIAAQLAADALPCPAVALEFSLITRSAAVDPGPAPAYELHGWDAYGRLRPDPGPGDPDLPLHFAAIRAGGVVVLGPPPHDVFRDVARGELLPRLVAELDWADANPSVSYRVLTACRVLRVLAEGRMCSKRAAAEWVLERGDSPALVATVLHHHIAATTPTGLDPKAVAAFTAGVRAHLQTAVDGDPRSPG
ncbi:MAG: aminoglycoside adenylyltransferase domain-containing protein [Gaiellales bacterium]